MVVTGILYYGEHHPIEHCCHSEYNVLCPKILMIGACLRYLLSSKNFTSSLHLISQEVPGIYVLPYKRGKREITIPCLVICIALVLLVACLNYYLLAYCEFCISLYDCFSSIVFVTSLLCLLKYWSWFKLLCSKWSKCVCQSFFYRIQFVNWIAWGQAIS